MRKIRVLDNVYDLITINMEDRFKDNVAFRFYDPRKRCRDHHPL